MMHSSFARSATAFTLALALALTTSALPVRAETATTPAPAPASTAAPASTSEYEASSEPERTDVDGRPLWPVAIGIGTTALFLGLGVYFIGKSKDTSNALACKDVLAQNPDPTDPSLSVCANVDFTDLPTIEPSDETTYTALGVTGFVGAGLAAAATAAYLLWPSSDASASEDKQKSTAGRSPKASARVFPTLSPTGMGMGVVGSF